MPVESNSVDVTAPFQLLDACGEEKQRKKGGGVFRQRSGGLGARWRPDRLSFHRSKWSSEAREPEARARAVITATQARRWEGRLAAGARACECHVCELEVMDAFVRTLNLLSPVGEAR
jgi:hypothetical protein